MNATFVQRGETVDFVPDRDIPAGTVIPFGPLIGITRVPIAVGELGTLALSGVFDVVKVDEAVPAGSRVYWDTSRQRATIKSEGTLFLGVAVCHCSALAAKTRVIINFGAQAGECSGSHEGIQWQTIQ